MMHLKEQAEQLYVELFGYIAVPKPDYISQIIHLMSIIQNQNQTEPQEVKRGRKTSNKTGE